MYCVSVLILPLGMQHSGIGGGGFMLVRSADGTYESIGMSISRFQPEIPSHDIRPDFRETAPAAAYEDMYKDNVIGSIQSGLASGVPGDIAGLEYVHNRYGVSSSVAGFVRH